jgi:hypothetical protein
MLRMAARKCSYLRDSPDDVLPKFIDGCGEVGPWTAANAPVGLRGKCRA